MKKPQNLFGIYKIINTITGDFYIGSTTESFNKRWSKHKSDYNKSLNGYRQVCPILYNAFSKYGIENFKMLYIYSFYKHKSPTKTKQLVTYLEEKVIQRLQPKYNICTKPSLGGVPNLGRKLSGEWKNNIAKKSKLYKHSKETLKKVTKNNKQNSSKFKVVTTNETFEGTAKQCAEYFNIDVSTIYNYINGKYKHKNFISVEKIKSQKKIITLFKNDWSKTFESYNQCDKYLNMWRGFTSTQVTRKRDKILDFDYIIEDIV